MSRQLMYITLNQLMASVEGDLHSFADNGLIDRGKVIKVIRRVNEDLGLKIFRDKSVVIDVFDFKGRLPEDFMLLQSACICTKFSVNLPGASDFGTLTEDSTCTTVDLCTCEKTQKPIIKQIFTDKTVTYTDLVAVKVTKRSHNHCAMDCGNKHVNSPYEIDITQEGELFAGFEEGKVYISYLADMVDDEGNLLILDHPLLRDYYEYAVKKHLIEVWLLNNDADVTEKWKLVKAELYESRLRALNFVNTIEYSHIQKAFEANRRRFYNKHIRLFE